MQRPPKGPAGGAVAKSHIPAAPVIGSLPAPRFSLDMPEIYLPPASLEASSLVRLCAHANLPECRNVQLTFLRSDRPCPAGGCRPARSHLVFGAGDIFHGESGCSAVRSGLGLSDVLIHLLRVTLTFTIALQAVTQHSQLVAHRSGVVANSRWWCPDACWRGSRAWGGRSLAYCRTPGVFARRRRHKRCRRTFCKSGRRRRIPAPNRGGRTCRGAASTSRCRSRNQLCCRCSCACSGCSTSVALSELPGPPCVSRPSYRRG